MSADNTALPEPTPPEGQQETPDPALRRLDVLVGAWEMRGRTLDSQEDNFFGRVTIEWLEGGFFLLLRGEIDFMGFKLSSLEIVGYNPMTKMFPAQVYSSMSGSVSRYFWDVQDDTVTHWTAGAKYTGKLSKDGKVLAGGWRPEEGFDSSPGNTYDATMIRTG